MEVLTWCQLKLLNAKVHIFDLDGYWQPLNEMLSHIVEQGFMHSTNLDYVFWAKTADELIDKLEDTH
jgi:predicted Rossmann-fold nucleotide-binding protein